MERKEFTLSLSNPVNDPNMTPSSFQVRFQKPIELFDKRDWEVGLSEIFLPPSGQEVSASGELAIRFIRPNCNFNDIDMDPGKYTPIDYTRQVNKTLRLSAFVDEEGTMHRYQTRLRYDCLSKHMGFFIGAGEELEVKRGTGLVMLGVSHTPNSSSVTFSNPDAREGVLRHVGRYPVNFITGCNGSVMDVHCDIVMEPGTCSDVIRTVNIQPKSNGREVLYKKFDPIEYKRFSLRSVHQVRIRLSNIHDDDLTLAPARTTVILKIRPVTY